jgi:hypothetical protein
MKDGDVLHVSHHQYPSPTCITSTHHHFPSIHDLVRPLNASNPAVIASSAMALKASDQ